MIVSHPNEQTVRDALRQVIDPELDCNIVDLGLIYSIHIQGTKVSVAMTLTTPACPMQERIAMGVQSALLNLDSVEEVDVDLVWDPPWSPARMTEEGRSRMGIYES
ncbi:MAG TPA: metal-sulfur cluster assembly factor [Candidatus Kapabacteria bacterium]|nr:metal-sulfur cluster assembly factor [Candidatus Kapabacteria bacterium]